MNLIFHDRSAAAPQPGAATLSIERTGNFTFSAGAVAALQLAIGTPVVLAQDADANAWFLLKLDAGTPVHLKPFLVRTAGAKNGGRLVFSSAVRAKAFYDANPLPVEVQRQRLDIGLAPVPYEGGGKLYPLRRGGDATAQNSIEETVAEFFGSSAALPAAAPAPEPVAPTPMHRKAWTTEDVATLRRLYPTTMAKDVAQQLGRSLSVVQQKASELLLKKEKPAPAAAKPPVVPTVPKAGKGRPLGSGEDDINPALAERMNKVVQRLGGMKLFKMDEHEARQALKLLTDHRDKLDWVPGGAQLRERLAGCYSLSA